jgi:cation diffusion facilitator family transporter
MKDQKRRSPFLIMGAVLAMYALKAVVKYAAGSALHSPMITGDAVHNAADFGVVLIVMAVLALSLLPATAEYPFGRKNVESIARAVIGVGLLVTALHFAAESLAGLLSYAPSLDQRVRSVVPGGLPEFQPLRMDAGLLPYVLLITVTSAALSFFVGWIEIREGKAGGHPSMVADGQETRSDGLIEVVILVGVCAEYLFKAAWLEYPLGMGVSFLVARTGYELLSEGWRALLQRSLGREVETTIRATCLSLRGINNVDRVTTFQVGSRAICILKLTTSGPAEGDDDVKAALIGHLNSKLAELGHEDAEFYIRFSRPDAADARVAYAATTDGTAIAVVPELSLATHAIICDLKHGAAVRWTLLPVPKGGESAVLKWLEEKRVVRLYLFGDRQTDRRGKISIHGVPSYDLHTLGLAEPTA